MIMNYNNKINIIIVAKIIYQRYNFIKKNKKIMFEYKSKSKYSLNSSIIIKKKIRKSTMPNQVHNQLMNNKRNKS